MPHPGLTAFIPLLIIRLLPSHGRGPGAGRGRCNTALFKFKISGARADSYMRSERLKNIHAAAAEYCTLHRDSAAPWPVRVDDLQEVRRLNPGPGVRGLMYIASHYGLADIDVVHVGLRPVARVSA